MYLLYISYSATPSHQKRTSSLIISIPIVFTGLRMDGSDKPPGLGLRSPYGRIDREISPQVRAAKVRCDGHDSGAVM